MDIKPNNFCPCGSGKKYKKCCMNNNEKQLGFSDEYPLADEVDGFGLVGYSSNMPYYYCKHPHEDYFIPAHACDIGSKPFVLAIIEELMEHIDNKDDFEIKDTCTVLLKMSESADYYYEYLKTFANHTKTQINTIKEKSSYDKRIIVSKPELILCRHLYYTIMLDYQRLNEYKGLDYGSFRASTEYTHKIISSNKIRYEYVGKLTIYVLEDRIKSWEVLTTPEHRDNFFVDWKPLNEIENLIKIYETELPGLENQSRKDLASLNETLKRHKQSGHNTEAYFSYGQLAWGYFNIIERELNSIIYLEHKANDKKKMSYFDLSKYIFKNPLQSIETTSATICRILDVLRPLRNKCNHGGEINKEEFNKIEAEINGIGFIDVLSRAKCNLRASNNTSHKHNSIVIQDDAHKQETQEPDFMEHIREVVDDVLVHVDKQWEDMKPDLIANDLLLAEEFKKSPLLNLHEAERIKEAVFEIEEQYRKSKNPSKSKFKKKMKDISNDEIVLAYCAHLATLRDVDSDNSFITDICLEGNFRLFDSISDNLKGKLK